MILEAAISLIGGAILGASGWSLNKAVEVTRQVTIHAEKIEKLEQSQNHIVDRVDAIYDHLVAKSDRS